jgi:2,4-dienoyl-CoA reductase-like NADH-dependent reductase (Old Yellow Enzyme family)
MPGTLLFSPMTIRGVELKNRIVVPPMHQYSGVKGFPTDWHLMNSGKFAAGGAGLVVVESTKVERRGCGTVGDLGIWDDAFVEPLSRLVKFIHQQNSIAAFSSAIPAARRVRRGPGKATSLCSERRTSRIGRRGRRWRRARSLIARNGRCRRRWNALR